MRTKIIGVLVCLVVLICAAGAVAQSVDCNSPTSVAPDGRTLSGSIPAVTTFWFSVAARGTSSYAAEANYPTAADSAFPALNAFAPTDVQPGCSGTSTLSPRNIMQFDPVIPNGNRVSITAASAMTILVSVTNSTMQARDFTVRVAETTLFNPLWSTFGGFETFYRLQNTTRDTLNVTLRLINDAGTTVATHNQPLAANATAPTIFTGPGPAPGLGVPDNQAGQAILTHDGPPGALQVDGFLGLFTATPVVLPIKIVPAREGVSVSRLQPSGGGGGDITAVNTAAGSGLEGGASTGDVNLSMMTCSDTQILQRSGGAWACASPGGGGSVTSVGQGTGIIATPNPIIGSGTIEIDPAVVPQLGAVNTFTQSNFFTAAGTGLSVTNNATVDGFLTVDTSTLFVNPITNRVGVGTASPGVTFDVARSDGLFQLARFRNANPLMTGDHTSAVIWTNGNASVTEWILAVGGTNNGLGLTTGQFYLERIGAGAQLVADTSGNFGFGTTVPTSKLHVVGQGRFQVASATPPLVIPTAFASGATVTNLSADLLDGMNSTAFATSNHTHALAGTNNTGVGAGALAANAGANNTAMGANALLVNTTGAGNTAIGAIALDSNTTGDSNTAVGGSALGNNISGSVNVAVGTNALGNNTIGTGNTAVGNDALALNVASDNTAVGAGALDSNGSGTNNAALGRSALGANTTGADNTAVGINALGASSTFNNNTAVGANALALSTANSNTAVGSTALDANTTGQQNTAAGAFALTSNVTGSDNTAVGTGALQLNTSSNNTAVGSLALDANTTGTNNTAVGFNALSATTTGGNNTAVGTSALSATVNGGNTAVGSLALTLSSTGFQNTAVGSNALDANIAGTNNTAVGFNALTNSTGSGNIAIGKDAGIGLGAGNDNIYIGNNGQSESSTIRIGGGTQTRAFIAGTRGVTTGVADAIPVVIDSAGQLGTISSTRRVKEDIRDMGAASERLLQLRPVLFRYRQPMADGSKPLEYGLIAEEVAEVMPELVVYDKDGQPQTVQYHVLPALLLNELQHQQKELAEQEAELAELRAQKAEVAALRQALAAQAAELAELKAALRGQVERAGIR